MKTITIRPHSSMLEREFKWSELDGACKYLLEQKEITARQIQGLYCEMNSAFVSAMLAALPGFSHTIRPIKLIYGQKQPVLFEQEFPETIELPQSLTKANQSFRSSASFGKRQEFIAVAELLRRGFDVYMTLVDDQQIDCIIRLEDDRGNLRYLDIQIKARSADCAQINAGRFAAMEIRRPRQNFYFIFYSEQANTYWIMPSLDLVQEANQNKEGKNKGKFSINFCNVTANRAKPRPRFRKFENNFDLLSYPDRIIE